MSTSSISSRAAVAGLLLALALVAGCGGGNGDAPRVIVLGIDGMDYELTRKLIEEGRLPNLQKLAETGSFEQLGTSVPPLSPVAWSNFITGLDAGGHGIFDFIHRDAETMIPYLSTSQPAGAGKALEIGDCQVPLSAGGFELLRRGQPFWDVLEDEGIETTIIRMPANFPPSGTATRELTGMGTPDLTGSYGTFSFYTSELFFEKRDVAGGEFYELEYWDGVARGKLHGPTNPFRKDGKKVTTEFKLHVDETAQAVKLEVGDEERIVEVGGWTDWVPVEFELECGITLQTLPAMTRFYLRQVSPEVELYAAPLNYDPFEGGLPISTPESYAKKLAKKSGRFHTQGMPEDTQALKGRVLTPAEFMEQARVAGHEVEEMYSHVLEDFDGGLLFYYFGNLDQVSHMMWHAMDPEHPAYDEARDGPFRDVVVELYERADELVGEAMARAGEDTMVIVMSDHGFSSWRRTVHVNAWLRDEGYLGLRNPDLAKDPGLYLNVDWSRTRAYGLGLNGLYINVAGREKNGIVPAAQRAALVDEIAAKLLEVVDPKTGEPAITRVYKRDEYFRDRGGAEVGPDLVIGYAKGTRGSSASALGEMEAAVFSDNTGDWGGDHGMDHETVPGVLFSNRPFKKTPTNLQNLAGSIVAEFGIDDFPRLAPGS